MKKWLIKVMEINEVTYEVEAETRADAKGADFEDFRHTRQEGEPKVIISATPITWK